MATKTETNPVINLPAPKFKYGFEVEGAYPSEKYDTVRKIVNSIYPKGGVIGDDCSLEFNDSYETVEIKTPAQSELRALANIFKLFYRLNGIGFKTNKTCGFHVNLSETKLFKQPLHSGEQKLQKFCCGMAQHLDVIKWRKQFKRDRNYFCGWNDEKRGYFKNPWSVWGSWDKCSAININNIKHVGNASQRRLELRIAGNENYHSNYSVMKEYLQDVQKAAHLSYQHAHG